MLNHLLDEQVGHSMVQQILARDVCDSGLKKNVFFRKMSFNHIKGRFISKRYLNETPPVHHFQEANPIPLGSQLKRKIALSYIIRFVDMLN